MTNIPAFVVAPDEGLKYQIILIRVTQDEILLKCPVLTSSSRLLCSFCCSIRFCLSASSWRLYSSCSRSCCSWRSCWRRSASERSLFSCCSRMKSRRRVDSPGTLTMELHGAQMSFQNLLAAETDFISLVCWRVTSARLPVLMLPPLPLRCHCIHTPSHLDEETDASLAFVSTVTVTN